MAKEREARQAAERVAEALRQSEQQVRKVIEATPGILVFLKDLEGRYVNVNAGRRVKPEDLCGKTDHDLFLHKIADLHAAGDKMVLDTRQPLQTEEVLVMPDGMERTFLTSKFPFLDAAGKPYALGGIVLDITERKRMERALRESEERFRSLVEQASDAFFVHDDKGAIIDVNRQACDSLGYTREELLRLRIADIQPNFDLSCAQAAWRQFKPGEGHTVYGYQQRRDGSVFPVEIRLSTCYRAGQRHYLGLVRNISVQKQSEQALLRSEKLASVGRMAATIAHEINNPLEAVTNLLFLAQECEAVPEGTRQYLENAQSELKRVAHITRQSLGFYRESNAPAPMSVQAVIESAVDLLKSRIKAKHALIKTQWDKEIRITAVAGELRQVFANLLANSLDAIEERGTIRLKASHNGVHDANGCHVRITVADSGQGIPAAARRCLFEPFFTTKGTFGTGLGLWVSKQIVEKHGGKIRVRSAESGSHRGTAISIILPAESRATAD